MHSIVIFTEHSQLEHADKYLVRRNLFREPKNHMKIRKTIRIISCKMVNIIDVGYTVSKAFKNLYKRKQLNRKFQFG